MIKKLSSCFFVHGFIFVLHYYVAIRTKEDMYMSKNNIKLGIAGLTAAATGAALFTAKKSERQKERRRKESYK